VIRGGREPSLQIRHLPQVLAEIKRLGAVEPASCDLLLEGYRFLRRVENVLQEIGDQQTQTLPDNERDQLRLVTALGFADWQSFMARLDKVMAAIHREFNSVIGEEKRAEESVPQLSTISGSPPWRWQSLFPSLSLIAVTRASVWPPPGAPFTANASAGP